MDLACVVLLQAQAYLPHPGRVNKVEAEVKILSIL
jgi:hypothetical protein